jgi:hypothetical protein
VNEQIYRKLAERLDAFPIGFPATGSGVELQLLARIFTQEEAALASVMDSTPEPDETITMDLANYCGAHTAIRLKFSPAEGEDYASFRVALASPGARAAIDGVRNGQGLALRDP